MVSHVSLGLHRFLTLSTVQKKMRIAEKRGDLPIFDMDILTLSAPALFSAKCKSFF